MTKCCEFKPITGVGQAIHGAMCIMCVSRWAGTEHRDGRMYLTRDPTSAKYQGALLQCVRVHDGELHHPMPLTAQLPQRL